MTTLILYRRTFFHWETKLLPQMGRRTRKKTRQEDGEHFSFDQNKHIIITLVHAGRTRQRGWNGLKHLRMKSFGERITSVGFYIYLTEGQEKQILLIRYATTKALNQAARK